MLTIKTKYYGIDVQIEYNNETKSNEYWIVDDNGNDEYFGRALPTDADVDNYRDRV